MKYFHFYKDVHVLKGELDRFKTEGQLRVPLLMLAPMAGYSDLPFRSLVKHFGVDVSVSEMISSHAMLYENAKTLRMLERAPSEVPYALQISGSKEDVLARCVEKINDLDFVDIVDLNCGCPAPKVASHGGGSGLLRNLDLFVKLLRVIREHSNKRIFSVKVRLGFDKKIPSELAHAINESGVDYCVVHARTKVDSYRRDRIDYDSLALMKEILRIPLIANGEIRSLQDYRRVRDITKCDGVMIGRAALDTPWIFLQIRSASVMGDDVCDLSGLVDGASFIPPPEHPDSTSWDESCSSSGDFSLILKRYAVLMHLDSMYRFYGDRGVIMFRKNLHAYAKGLDGSSHYRDFVNSVRDYDVLRDSVIKFFSSGQTHSTTHQ